MNDRVFEVEKQKYLTQIEQLAEKIKFYEIDHPYAQLAKEFAELKESSALKQKTLENAIEKRNNRIYKIDIELEGHKTIHQELEG
jgi:hypothetical protein